MWFGVFFYSVNVSLTSCEGYVLLLLWFLSSVSVPEVFALQSSIVPFFSAPCCFNFLLIFRCFLLSLLFLHNVACRTCLLPHLGWEWSGLLRGDQHVITAEIRVWKEFESVLFVCWVPELLYKGSRTLRSCRKASFWRQADGYTWAWVIMDEPPVGLWTAWGASSALALTYSHVDTWMKMCKHVHSRGEMGAALLHMGASLEG